MKHIMELIFSAAIITAFPIAASEWSAWRGPHSTGSAEAQPPAKWSETANVLWKVTVPGRGHSSPIVWKDKLFLTTAIESDKEADAQKVKAVEEETPEFHRKQAFMPKRSQQFTVMALNSGTGSVLWKKVLIEEIPFSATHADGSWASGSPATDGERLYVYFGSYGLYCLDMNGTKIWEKRFGLMKMKANFGEGISPVICGDMVILNLDQEGTSSLVALDKKTGQERWKVSRDEATSWATPLVIDHKGRRQVVVSATKKIRAYDPSNGSLIWECAGMTGNVIPCPVYDGERVICMSGFRGAALLAIKLSAAAGDITGKSDAIAWSLQKDTPYVPSPVLSGGLLYFLKNNDGYISCADAATGKIYYGAQKLDGIKLIFSSPIEAGGMIYVPGRDGTTVVLKTGTAFEVIAVNKIDDQCTASPAAAGARLYLRGHTKLYCFSDEKRPK